MKTRFKIEDVEFSIDADIKSRNGRTETNLKVTEPTDANDVAWNFGVDVFESFILALVCAGYKMDKKMREVLYTVMDAMTNHVDDVNFSAVIEDTATEMERLRRDLVSSEARLTSAIESQEATEHRVKDVLAYNKELQKRLKLVKEVTDELIGRVIE